MARQVLFSTTVIGAAGLIGSRLSWDKRGMVSFLRFVFLCEQRVDVERVRLMLVNLDTYHHHLYNQFNPYTRQLFMRLAACLPLFLSRSSDQLLIPNAEVGHTGQEQSQVRDRSSDEGLLLALTATYAFSTIG